MKRVMTVILILTMAACGKGGDHPPQTKEWYLQHDTERHARVKECKNDASLEVSADCQNAITAQQQITVFGK